MRKLVVIPSLTALLLIMPTTATADVEFGLRIGPSAIVVGPDGVRGRVILGPRARRQKKRLPRERRAEDYRRPRQIVIVRERDRDPEPQVEPEPDPNPEPVVTDPRLPGGAAEVPAALPDPTGHARIARAPAFARAPFRVGDLLANGTPHVTLDPVRFGLPRPPEGEIYARVRGQVLRITQISRRITEIITR